ncbi:MAG: hypothetical protein KA186_02535 [Flavobacteriales bacterium]|nr:hypothetical protein [Flavobacteriales bacterium]
MEAMRILSTTIYRNGRFSVDGKELARSAGDLDHDLTKAWTAMEVELPRFVRMDRSSKLVSIAAAPFFAADGALSKYPKDRIGMVIMGTHGSMDTDQRYLDQLEAENHASPGLFVYTLPNIAMGELSIQHGLHGSGLCLLSDAPDIPQLHDACDILLHDHDMEAVICGWSNIFAGSAEATFMVVTAGKEGNWDNDELERIFNEHG